MLTYEGFQIQGGQRLLLAFTEESETQSTLLWHVPDGYDKAPFGDPAADFDASEDGLLIGGHEHFFPDSIEEVQDLPGANVAGLQQITAADLQDGDQLLFVDEGNDDGLIEWEVRLTFSEEMWEDDEQDHFYSVVPLVDEASCDSFYLVARRGE